MRWGWTTLVGLGVLGLAGRTVAQDAPSQNFFFYWPETSRQCEIIDLTWTNATPPFTAYIIPIFSRPFVYDIPDEAYSNGQGRYTIELQLQQGAYYTMFMSDARGFGSGGSSEVQVVGASYVTSCLNTISANATNQQFSFSPAGRARQCLKGFDVSWGASPQDQPYNMSVIPLDQGFYPYEVDLANGGFDGDWQVNMTAGTRFTIMLNSARGYGRGGVGGIYEVDNSTRSDCVLQEPQPTGTWPRGLATNTLASSTSRPEDESSSLGGGAIAGIVIGVLAFLILLGLILFFLLRRKRRRQALRDKENRIAPAGGGVGVGAYDVDLGEGYDEREEGEEEGTVDPYRSESLPDTAEGGTSTAGLAGLGAAMGVGAGSAPDQHQEGGEGSRPQAGPLPPKLTSLDREGQGLRIANPANPAGLPTLPQGASLDDSPIRSPARDNRPRNSQDHLRQPTFRRHEDAGRWSGQQEQPEVVDLPPLYTDIHRDGESEAGRGL